MTPRLPLASLALSVAAFAWIQEREEPAPPEPGVQERGGRSGAGQEDDRVRRDIFGRRRTERGGTLHERLQGCWQLVDMQVEGLPPLGRQGRGVLLVGESFLAFELHAGYPEAGGRDPDVHQSFIADYELTPERTLRCTTVIGSYIDDQARDLAWERPGFPREFRVSELDDMLVLRFDRTNRMAFAPRRPRQHQERDVFGRKVREAATGRDIFGRPTSGERGESGDPRRRDDPPPESGDGG